MRTHTWKSHELQRAVRGTGRVESDRIEPIVRSTREPGGQTRVLCATDLATRSQRALVRAMLLARKLDAHLIVLHVVAAEHASNSARAGDQITRQLSSVGVVTRRDPEIRIRTGNHVQGIAETARETGADVIVLGVGDPSPQAPPIGTTAGRITALAERPVLIANREPHRRYGAVVIAAELSEAFVQVIRVASSLMFLDAETVSIVHRFEFPRGPLLAFDTRAAGRHLDAWETAARARVLRHLDAAGVESSRFRIILQQPPPARAIRRIIRSVKAGLLIVGANDRSIATRAMRGGLVNDALRNLECDILVAAPKVESATGTANHDTGQRIDLKPRGLHLS